MRLPWVDPYDNMAEWNDWNNVIPLNGQVEVPTAAECGYCTTTP